MGGWFLSLYAVLGISGLLAYRYLERLPQRLHDEGLERFRASLARDLELTKISQGELQVHKTQEFVRLSEFMHEIISDPGKSERALKNEGEKRKLKKRLLSSAVGLFFFASDETIEAYKAWWQTAQRLGRGERVDAAEPLVRYAELNVSIRRDLGYPNTACNSDDFLQMILTDWDEYKEKRTAGEASDA